MFKEKVRFSFINNTHPHTVMIPYLWQELFSSQVNLSMLLQSELSLSQCLFLLSHCSFSQSIFWKYYFPFHCLFSLTHCPHSPASCLLSLSHRVWQMRTMMCLFLSFWFQERVWQNSQTLILTPTGSIWLLFPLSRAFAEHLQISSRGAGVFSWCANLNFYTVLQMVGKWKLMQESCNSYHSQVLAARYSYSGKSLPFEKLTSKRSCGLMGALSIILGILALKFWDPAV